MNENKKKFAIKCDNNEEKKLLLTALKHNGHKWKYGQDIDPNRDCNWTFSCIAVYSERQRIAHGSYAFWENCEQDGYIKLRVSDLMEEGKYFSIMQCPWTSDYSTPEYEQSNITLEEILGIEI